MNNKLLKLLGLFLIVIGVGYLGDQLNLWYFTIFFRGWWAVLVCVLAFASMLEDGINWLNGIFGVLGIYWFLEANNIIDLDVSIMILLPIACIVLGIKMLFLKKPQITYDNSFVNDLGEKEDTQSTMHDTTFESTDSNDASNIKKIYVNSSFSTKSFKENATIDKCQIENIFGNVFLDLSHADLSMLEIMSIHSFFGNVEVHVPSNVNLKLYKNTMFSGSYIDGSYSENGHDIYIRGTSVFGTIRVLKKPV